MKKKTIQYFESASTLTQNINRQIMETEIVLDIGPGIYPFNAFVPKFHILVEPWQEYISILRSRFQSDSRVLIIKSEALSFVRSLDDDSIDSAVLIDVIEHMEKKVGLNLVKELERVTRKQIIIFTPLGFMPQHVNSDKGDRWGLRGGEFQEHLSGWTPSDFEDDWSFFVCESFHQFDDAGNPLSVPFGAFYAIKNCTDSATKEITEYAGTFFRLTPKDSKIEKLMSSNKDLETQLLSLMSSNKDLETQLLSLMSSNKDLETHILEQKSVIEELITKHSKLLRENWGLINSSSWKITKPLRLLSEYFGKVWKG